MVTSSIVAKLTLWSQLWPLGKRSLELCPSLNFPTGDIANSCSINIIIISLLFDRLKLMLKPKVRWHTCIDMDMKHERMRKLCILKL